MIKTSNISLIIGKNTVTANKSGSSFKMSSKILGYDTKNKIIKVIYIDKLIHTGEKAILSACGKWEISGAISSIIKPVTII